MLKDNRTPDERSNTPESKNDRNTLYVTTPIYYVNGNPHLGHAHTSVMGDIMHRIAGMRGMDSFFTTGVDEHGQKNQQEMIRLGLSAEQFLREQSSRFQNLFDLLNVGYNHFVRTSCSGHKDAVTALLSRIREKNLIFKKEYSGLYCEGCEQFKLSTDLDSEGRCPDHLVVPREEREENYFISLEPHRQWLAEYIRDHSGWIQPEQYSRQVLDMLKEPLPDLCISRPKSRVTLGVEFPFDSDYVAYVWFDALINYISSIGYPGEFDDERWKGSVHLMGKDIIKTHCIYWPIMLRLADLPPVGRNMIHGYWVGEDGRKMSKSLGNGVDPREVAGRFGVDAFRFFLTWKMASGEVRISMSLVEEFYNSILGNILGNGYQRIISLAHKYSNGSVPGTDTVCIDDRKQLELFRKRAAGYLSGDIDLDLIREITCGTIVLGKELNKYIDSRKPWQLQKDPECQNEVKSILRVSLEMLRLVFELAFPVMPEISGKVLTALGAPDCGGSEMFRLQDGHKIPAPEPLFPKLD